MRAFLVFSKKKKNWGLNYVCQSCGQCRTWALLDIYLYLVLNMNTDCNIIIYQWSKEKADAAFSLRRKKEIPKLIFFNGFHSFLSKLWAGKLQILDCTNHLLIHLISIINMSHWNIIWFELGIVNSMDHEYFWLMHWCRTWLVIYALREWISKLVLIKS